MSSSWLHSTIGGKLKFMSLLPGLSSIVFEREIFCRFAYRVLYSEQVFFNSISVNNHSPFQQTNSRDQKKISVPNHRWYVLISSLRRTTNKSDLFRTGKREKIKRKCYATCYWLWCAPLVSKTVKFRSIPLFRRSMLRILPSTYCRIQMENLHNKWRLWEHNCGTHLVSVMTVSEKIVAIEMICHKIDQSVACFARRCSSCCRSGRPNMAHCPKC